MMMMMLMTDGHDSDAAGGTLSGTGGCFSRVVPNSFHSISFYISRELTLQSEHLREISREMI